MPEVTRASRSHAKQWLILASSAAGAVAISSAIGILPTYRIAGAQATVALGIAAVVIWAVGAIGAVPVALTRAADARAVLTAVQVGMAVRFMLALAAAVALAFGTSLPRTALLLWIGIHYLVVLAVTTTMEVWLLRRKPPEASA